MGRIFRLYAPAALALALAGCGGGDGGGGGIASTPPPAPTLAPAMPHLTSISIDRVAPLSDRAGMTAGTFDTKAVHSDGNSEGQALKPSEILAPGSVRLGIDPANPTYTVTATVAGFPAQERFDFGAPNAFTSSGTPFDRSGFGYRILRTEHYSDGSMRTSEEDITSAQYSSPRVPIAGGGYEVRKLYLDISHRYVSLGGWNREFYEPVPGETGVFRYVRSDHVGFVQGLRTQPADIPASGTATYRDEYTSFGLSADFGARRIGAEIEYPYSEGYFGEGGSGPSDGLSARGSAAITSTGDFLIPLNGSFIGFNGATTAVFTGIIDGAFFGPQAAEVGGVYQFFKDGADLGVGTFAATKGP